MRNELLVDSWQSIVECLETDGDWWRLLAREGGGLPRVGKRGVKPLSINLFPLSFKGEGDKGGEVSKHSHWFYKQGFSG